jgi:hypothetical protein
MDTCSNCGLQLEEQQVGTERQPCPGCGALNRAIGVGLSLPATLGDHVMLELGRDGDIIAFRESERQGRTGSADVEPDGTASWSLTGTPPQNEEDTPYACRTLVQALNAAGEDWSEPTSVDIPNVDCVSKGRANEKIELRIQVVRAIASQDTWKLLRKSGQVGETTVSPDELSTVMASAVRKKAEHISDRVVRAGIVLALDATRLPVFTLDVVVNRCRELYGAEIRAAGFKSVWVVGPSQSLTKRIDGSS